MLTINEKEISKFSHNPNFVRMAERLRDSEAIEAIEIQHIETEGYKIYAVIEDQHEFELNMQLGLEGNVLNFNSNHYVFRPERVYVLLILLTINKIIPKHFPFIYHSDKYIWQMELKNRREAEKMMDVIETYRLKSERELIENIVSGVHRIKGSLIENRGQFKLKFKVGGVTGPQYMIKNVQNFLTDVTRASFIQYGKKLAFKHDERNFDEPSKTMIAFMRKVLAVQSTSHYKNPIKELELTNGVMDDFFTIFSEIPTSHRDFILQDALDLPTLHIEKLSFYYKITLKTKHRYVLGQNHLYHASYDHRLHQSILVRTKLDEAGKTAGLIYRLSLQNEMIVNESNFNDFFIYVLSDIRNFIQLSGVQLEQLTEDEISIYADIDEQERTYATIRYRYENGIEKHGFDPENADISLSAHKIESYIKNHAEVDPKTKIAYLTDEAHQVQAFVNSGLPYLQQYANVYVSEALKQVGTKRKIHLTAGVTIKNDLLSINLDSLDIPRDELASVLASYRRKKKFHKLKNGEKLYLEADELEEVDQMLTSFQVDPTKMKDGHLDLELFHAFSVNAHAENDRSLIEFNRSDLFKGVIERFENIQMTEYELSPIYDNLLRDYQKYGYQWLRTLSDYGFGGILADDMGLGKTLQVIALLDQRKADGQISLVVAPASLILNWEDEIKKFSSDLKAASVYGTAKKRKETIQSYRDYDLLITSYDYIRRDVALYEDIHFNYIVLDEAQYIKNQSTKNAQSVKELVGKYKLALTGTPIENSLAELWSIFDFLMPGYLFPYGYFSREYERPIVKDKDEQKQLALKKLISPFILRRRKQDVLKELPDKIESTLTIEFKEEEKKLYLANLSQVNLELQDKLEMEKVNAIAILAMLTRLRQICCEPRVLYENIEQPSSKIEACMDLICRLKENGKKVLLFSSFTSVLALIQDALNQEGISHYVLTGATDKIKRRELVARFQEDHTEVFLISLKAGGTGLNLTAAEAVIHFDPWWNSSAQNQATDRAHRIGQEDTVQVFKLIMKESIEEKIQLLQEAKKDLADAFVEGNDGTITSMSREDIMALFTH
ncbi:MAG: DEAD/DEAH box helicase [Defluviitaleaceae bacterium]|nr:DEAD/DEAH box helicase [Defluviitaleaceae bacterium]